MSNVSESTIEVLHSGNSFEEWDQFVDESPQGCIFCRSWWLEAVCPGQYEILTLKKGSRIIGGMPIHRSRRLWLSAIHMPSMTQVLGVLLGSPSSDNYEKALSSETAVIGQLVNAIPKCSYFNMGCHYNFTNWLPFYWAGYDQTTCYTYVLEDLSHVEEVFAGFARDKRKNIKKAQAEVTVKEDLPAKDFYANHKMTLSKQNRKISYSYELFSRIYKATHERNAGKTWYAIDKGGNIHAAILVVFDSKSAYYLISTIDPEYRSSGAATLLVKNAIEYVSKYTEKFDFEGSMIKGVETSFRRFGAIQKPYFCIEKNRLPLFAKAYRGLRHIIINGKSRA